MHITFSPQRRDDKLTLELTAPDRIRINGELFNFGPLAEGDVLPAVPCEWVIGPVTRTDGVVHLTLILPHGPYPTEAQAFPQPMTVNEIGPIDIPHDLLNPCTLKLLRPFEVWRKASLQEDEGIDSWFGTFATKAEAEAEIASQDGGYFSVNDFYIVGDSDVDS